MVENDRQQSYEAVLADLEQRIAGLQRTAANIRALMELAPDEIMGANGGEVVSVGGSMPGQARRHADPLSLVKVGEFYNKSYTEAARDFLQRAREPQTTYTILEAMRKAQFELRAKNPGSTLYTALARHKGFVLVSRNTWGLAEWYPGADRRRNETKQLSKRKQRRIGKVIKAKKKLLTHDSAKQENEQNK